jgi:hypothetical protein
LNPSRIRVIRNTYEYSKELAANKYGYVFLVKEPTGKYTYDVYLGAVSFYSNTNS